MALTEKGIVVDSHYDSQLAQQVLQPTVIDEPSVSSGIEHAPENSTISNEDGGVFL